MREAVVVDSARTALCKSFRGSFNLTRPESLLAHALDAVMQKVPQVSKAEVEDIIVGCGQRRPLPSIVSVRLGCNQLPMQRIKF
jgi:acetyl-CoA acetyltransferase